MPAPKKLLSIDDILAADDLPTARVDCPEWGGQVEVKALTRAQVVTAIQAATDGDGIIDNGAFQMGLVIQGMGLTEDRLRQLDGKHTAPIKRVANKIRDLSGIGDDAGFPDD